MSKLIKVYGTILSIIVLLMVFGYPSRTMKTALAIALGIMLFPLVILLLSRYVDGLFTLPKNR